MEQKRNRGINWTEEERRLLQSIIMDYLYIFENKSLKSDINNSKIKAWKAVHMKFNKLNSQHRQLHQLQVQWKSMKMTAKKNLSSKMSPTSSGPSSPTMEDNEIVDLLNPGELLENTYHSVKLIPGTPNEDIVYTNDTTELVNETSTTTNIPCTDKVKRKGNKDCNYAKDILHHSKVLKDAEHASYMKNMAEAHELNVKILQRKAQLAEEKHSFEMTMLRKKYEIEQEILSLQLAKAKANN